MAVETSWLIGSFYIPATTLTIQGMPVMWPAGYYYLRHPTAAFSMVATLQGLLLSAGVVKPSVYIGKDRLTYVVADAGFTLTWPAALSSLFGFSTGWVGGATHTSEEISPLLWSAGKNESPQEAPLGVLGRSVYDTRFGTAPDGTTVADGHHVQKINTFTWGYVATSRFQTADSIGGEYTVFFDYVLRRGYKFFVYRWIQEDVDDDNPVTWTTGQLGPYVYRPTRGSITWDFQRSSGFANVDRRNNVALDTLITPEYT